MATCECIVLQLSRIPSRQKPHRNAWSSLQIKTTLVETDASLPRPKTTAAARRLASWHAQVRQYEQKRQHKHRALIESSVVLRSKHGLPSPPSSPDGNEDSKGWEELKNQASFKVAKYRTLRKSRERDARNQPTSSNLCRAICNAGESVDPFNATATPIDQWTHSLLQYYILVLVPSTFKSDAQALWSNKIRHLSATEEVVRGAMRNATHMHALLAASASRLKCVGGQMMITSGPKSYMAKAITKLRCDLIEKVEQIGVETIQDIFWQFICECYARHYQAAMVHMRATRHLVERMGGFAQLNRYMTESLCIGSILISIETFDAPPFTLFLDPGELPLSRMSWIRAELDCSVHERGKGMLLEVKHPILKPIVADLIQCMLVSSYVWSQSNPLPAEVQWVSLRYYAVLHHLLSLDNLCSSPLTPRKHRKRNAGASPSSCGYLSLLLNSPRLALPR
jgi:hypothetical protein